MMVHLNKMTLVVLGFMVYLSSPVILAEDVLEEKNIGMELARDLATESILACREKGFSVSAVVVDKHGNQRVALRDDFASKFTLQIAEEKANATVMSGLKSGEFRAKRGDIRPELNHVDGVLMMVGGVPIISGGARIGAIGVSGAPGGEKDEACVMKALEKFEDRLAF
ncbi:GlcG/HbpS family heme-binding protein [Thiomicrorhabdus lithotrophica]|uniref:Heme-binding protein n=1 Tax=Thiomicrorhabdus lithotrophica TaxID=2949997 RepID=A0ABY8CAM6_9GAMM|nr:heme-binding protein [Thiomicrorhabdus lithotrophica]WEJ61621.1 heme-binding protein [Thiomicrorhabdus lithotrophica]